MAGESILIVDDEVHIVELIKYNLESNGYKTYAAYDGGEALKIVDENEIDLIILDLMLPVIDGIEVCKTLKRRESKANIPIIMLTAKGDEFDRILGLELGADDYITKPFRIRELISRINAVLRRNRNVNDEKILVSGDISVYTLLGKVKKGDKELILTAAEYRLLITFMKNPMQLLKRSVILESLWDCGGEFVDDNTLSVYIRRLREKIEDNAAEPNYIVTVRGFGYKWNMNVRG